MTRQVLIAGGGIGGVAAALALGRAGCGVRLFERAGEFSEVGAGIQMGPNVVRVLQAWGLADGLADVAAFPARLQVRSATSGLELGALRLGDTARQRYGAPYATAHRADLLGLLLGAARQTPGVALSLQHEVTGFMQTADQVTVQCSQGSGPQVLNGQGDALIGADGLWSPTRHALLNDGPPRVTGHLAYRALLPQAALPQPLRSQHITVWLGPRLHLVQYPVRAGDWLNVVGIVHGAAPSSADPQSWDQGATAADFRSAMAGTCAPLQDLINAMTDWRRWVLCDRQPMRGAHEHARGRVALMGDAAHPMRPYLAQGAGMAIEDAAELARVLSQPELDVPTALGQFADARWQRNARVQARAIRNGQIFHASGLVRWARDRAMGALGERVLDLPWLYAGSQAL